MMETASTQAVNETAHNETAYNKDENPKSPHRRKGLDAFTYGLGESVKSGLYGWLGVGTATTLALRFGGENEAIKENKSITWVRERPKKIWEATKATLLNFLDKNAGKAGQAIHRSFTGDGGKKWGTAAVMGFAVVGTVFSWVTHSFGLAAGYKKAKKELKRMDVESADNIRLTHSVKLLTEDNARLQEELAKVQRPDIAASRSESAPSL